MESLTDTQLAELASQLASMQLASLQVANEPSSSFDVAIKSYVDAQVLAADTRISDILAGSSDAFNTLIELKTALDSGDTSITTSLTNALSTETGRRTAEDTRLSGLIDTEKLVRESAVSSEASIRSAADTALDVRITSEESTRLQADSAHEASLLAVETDIITLSGSLSSLQGKQSEDDGKRQSDLSAESQRATQAESALGQSIAQEVTNRETSVSTAVSELTALLESEAGSRAGEVSQVQDALGQEIADRTEQTLALSNDKFDKSASYYKRESDNHLAIAGDAFLYIGDYWRIRANSDASSKRLEFEYSSDGTHANFRTAVPFIRGV
jgi:hypothetical protein